MTGQGLVTPVGLPGGIAGQDALFRDHLGQGRCELSHASSPCPVQGPAVSLPLDPPVGRW